MKRNDRQFEETGAFLDLMSKRERKRWKKEQAKLKDNKIDTESQEIINDDNIDNKINDN